MAASLVPAALWRKGRCGDAAGAADAAAAGCAAAENTAIAADGRQGRARGADLHSDISWPFALLQTMRQAPRRRRTWVGRHRAPAQEGARSRRGARDLS